MSTKKFKDIIKSLPISSSTSPVLRFLMSDNTEGILKGGISYTKSNKSGANLLYLHGAKGIALVIAIDNENVANYCMYLYIKLDNTKVGNIVIIANSGIAIQAHNQQSTVALMGPNNITQHVFSFSL